MKLRVLALLLALAVIPGAALADRPYPEAEPLMTDSGSRPAPMIQRSFNELDSDYDGRLSPTEAAQGAQTDSFWVLDRNSDGYLTRKEYDYQPN